MEIADWRQRIDELDRQLVDVLRQRCQCAVAIGALKRAQGLPITEVNRESDVLDNVVQTNRGLGGPLGDDALRRIFAVIMAEMRGLQQANR